jgi:NADH-quinone oxidoreductase subunit N
MMLFLSVELLSVGMYALAALPRDSRRAVEGGMKYFVMGGAASACMLYGMALLYGATGRIDLAGIGAQAASSGMAQAGLALLLVGMAFKVGVAPFHMWVPDAYQGATAVVAGFMAASVKVAVFGAMLRVLVGAFPSAGAQWSGLCWILAAFTLVLGNLAALSQTNLKRLLAYSSIAHSGYVLIGVVSAAGNASAGLSASIFYLIVYTAMTLGVFGLLAVAGRRGEDLETVDACAGMARRRPVTAAALTVLLASLAGLPPTAGFFSKFYVFRSAIAEGHLVLAVIGILGALVSAYYYLRPVVAMYMKPAGDAAGEETEPVTDWAPLAAVGVAVAMVVAIGLFPASTLDVAMRVVTDLVGR